jgi:integrase
VDKDHQTLSNIFQYAMVNRFFPGNPFSQRYKHYQRADLIKTSRTRAPHSADDIHQVAGDLLGKVAYEAAGWLSLFATFTGCRTSELLRLRLDAKRLGPERYEAGYVEKCDGDEPRLSRYFLHLGKRSKKGINPQVVIGPEFQAMLAAFQNWHQQRWPECPWYFPNERGTAALDRFTARRQIARAASHLGLHHITPHGYRSFYQTKRRSDGINDQQIAFEIGDKTVALVNNNYAKAPETWTGGQVISWLPKTGQPAWQGWLPKNLEKLDFSLTERKTENAESANRINDAGVAKWQTHRT